MAAWVGVIHGGAPQEPLPCGLRLCPHGVARPSPGRAENQPLAVPGCGFFCSVASRSLNTLHAIQSELCVFATSPPRVQWVVDRYSLHVLCICPACTERSLWEDTGE